MSTPVNWKQYTSIEVDGRAFALVALFVVVIAGSLAIRPWMVGSGVSPVASEATTSQQVAGGFGWALAEALFAGALLVFVLLWNRLPEWVRSILSSDLTLVLYMFLGAMAYSAGEFWTFALLAVVLYTVLKTADELDLWWMVNNVLVLGIAILGAAYLGVVLGVWILAAGLIGLSVYDYVFADRENWMFTLAESLLRWKIPVVFIVPKTLRLDWGGMLEPLEDDVDLEEAEPSIWFGLGTADLVLPAGFVVAVANEITWSVAGWMLLAAVIGGILLACYRIGWKLENASGGAGLPPLASGALASWALASVVVMAI